MKNKAKRRIKELTAGYLAMRAEVERITRWGIRMQKERDVLAELLVRAEVANEALRDHNKELRRDPRH